MQRRPVCLLLLLLAPALPVPAQAPASIDRPERQLSLYGVPLKDADAQRFLEAALAAGGKAQPAPAGTPPVFDMRDAGVPALEKFTLFSHEGRVAIVRFRVKGYGQDNRALRSLLLGKYGVPMTVSPRPLPFGAFGERAEPRGAFQWNFDGRMTLLYEHPRIGDVTLSYVDEARREALQADRVPGGAPRVGNAVRDRF